MKKPIALITGIAGQDGAYLAKLLIEKGYDVHGAIRRNSQNETQRLDRLGVSRFITFHDLDLTEPNNIVRLLRETPYHEVYNLGAQSFVAASWEQPVYTSDVNAMGVIRLLDALRTYAPEAKFYQASTSEMFGKVRAIPQNELTPFHPRSPYGAAKAFAHYITVNYRESFGLHTSSGILFNHESPLRGSDFVTRKITMGLARILTTNDKRPIELGNLSATRDWGYAGDYVDGMWRMLQQPDGDDYVLATGEMTSIRDFVNLTAEALDLDLEWTGEGLTETAVERKTGLTMVKVSPRFFRPAEVDQLLGDATKARTKLAWSPSVSIRELASMMAKADYDLTTA